jgi:glycosyltransferase involved in cell wall biosynthesis
MKTYFLVLAYNEQELLKSAVKNLKKVINEISLDNFQIIIVNDGSKDETATIALDCKNEIDEKIIIETNKKNIGGAKSIQNFLKTHDNGKLIVITGDNDMHTDLIKKLIVSSKKNDFVISFYINREVKGYLRSVISYFFNFILCTIFQVYAFYLQGPFVWPIEIVKNFNLKNNGVTFISEINIKLLKSNLKFSEISGISNVGSYKSTAISFKNILKVFQTLTHLIYEIYILKKFTKNSFRNLDNN